MKLEEERTMKRMKIAKTMEAKVTAEGGWEVYEKELGRERADHKN